MIYLSLIEALSKKIVVHWFMRATKNPEDAAEITVFITILLGLSSSSEICIWAPAFMKREVIRMIRVPAIKKLTLLE
jgi:hypothetical protein